MKDPNRRGPDPGFDHHGGVMSGQPSRRARLRRAARIVPVVLVLVAGCATPARAPSASPPSSAADIRIGAVFPLASNAGTLAKEELAGVQAAADFVNADGGIDGRRIVLDVQDLEPGTDAHAVMATLKADGAASSSVPIRRTCRSPPARPRTTRDSCTGRQARSRIG